MKNILTISLLAFFGITCTKKETLSVQQGGGNGTGQVNRPPVANGGVDQTITLPTNTVSLNGSGSTDPDNNINSYSWTNISGPASTTITNPTGVQTQVSNLIEGIYQFELKVTDAGGLFGRDTVQIVVNSSSPTNQPPVADAGVNQVITLPTNTVTLNGSGSTDPDNNIISYSWTKISGPASFTITNPTGVQTQVSILTEGIYQFELKVTDAGGLFGRDTVQIVVNGSGQTNQPPVANAGANQAITLPTNTVSLNGSGSTDPDNNIISYSWTKISGPASFTITNPTGVQTQVSNLTEGMYQFELKVTDAGGLFDTDRVNIGVAGGNVNFFFADPTGSIPPLNISLDPPVVLVTVTINNYPDGVIQGVWCNSCSPQCPIIFDYNGSPEMYTSFNLPAGTYTWRAETVVTNLTGYPVPLPFKQFMATPHSTQGTITVLPTDNNCVNIRIGF